MNKHIAAACLVISTLITAAAAAPTTRPSYQPIPSTQPDAAAAPVTVGPIPDDLRRADDINPFYVRCAVIDGIPIIGSKNVSDYAYLECAWTLDHLLSGRTMTLEALRRSKVRVGIIAVTEYTMDIPENQEPYMIARAAFNDRRSRGLGGLPLATCAEENLLNLRGDPYTAENITIHEFSHTVASAIGEMNPAWYRKLRDVYNAAKKSGNYGNSYASTNEQEYWAEGAQCWFDCANPKNAGGASNRAELKAKDPALAELLTEVYGDGEWRYHKTSDPKRSPEDLAHLAGFDRDAYPVFSFDNSPRIRAAATQPATTRPTSRRSR